MDETDDHDSSQSGYSTAVSEINREIVVLDSVTFVGRYLAEVGIAPDTRVLVTASYPGVYCSKLIEPAKPLGVIGLDCQVGNYGAGITGLWYFEALQIPAAATGVNDLELGNGGPLEIRRHLACQRPRTIPWSSPRTKRRRDSSASRSCGAFISSLGR
jgi:hypothetical protein